MHVTQSTGGEGGPIPWGTLKAQENESTGQVLGDLDEPSRALLSKSVSGDCPVPMPSFV